MKPSEAAKLLALAAAFDNRSFDESSAMAWADALTGLDVNDCADAIRKHYRIHTDWIMPAHIRQIATRYAEPERGAWKQLQPANPVPCPPEIKAQILEFSRRRQLPPDVEAATGDAS